MDTYKKGKALVKNSQRLLGSDERFSYFQQAHLTIKWELSQRRDGNKPVTFWKTAALSHSGDVFLEKQQQPVALGDIGCKQFPRGVFKNSP